jgi:hypothetical protein
MCYQEDNVLVKYLLFWPTCLPRYVYLYGDRAKQKWARRRQDMIDGSTTSYYAPRILNRDQRMESYQDWNELQVGLAMGRLLDTH